MPSLHSASTSTTVIQPVKTNNSTTSLQSVSAPKAAKEAYFVPPSTPLERPIVLPGLLARQSDVFTCSDSEDESMDTHITSKAKDSKGGFKYQIYL